MLLAACGGGAPADEPAHGQSPSQLERAIGSDLSARVGAPVYVRCIELIGVPLTCTVMLPDGSALPVALRDAGSAWQWSIEGRIVATAPIQTYVRELVRDLGPAQGVTCGPALLRLPPGGRVACHLERGGTAFVGIGSDGLLGVEIELDPAAAAARDEPETRAHDRALDGLSRGLAPGSDDE